MKSGEHKHPEADHVHLFHTGHIKTDKSRRPYFIRIHLIFAFFHPSSWLRRQHDVLIARIGLGITDDKRKDYYKIWPQIKGYKSVEAHT